MRRAAHLIRDNVELLRQGLEVLEKLPDDLYASEAEVLTSGSIGAHFRHCIDFYACLLRDADTGRVDFDRRERSDVVERDRHRAMDLLRELAERLPGLERLGADAALQVRVDADSDDAPWCGSSLGRELRALLSHTVHHFSVVRLLLESHPDALPEGFGIAPSTLRHRRENRPR